MAAGPIVTFCLFMFLCGGIQMIFVISPAKALDFSTPAPCVDYTQADFLQNAAQLIDILRQKSPAEVAALMKLSDKLAALNAARYESWSLPFTPDNAKQALFAFNGDVYEGLDAATLTVDNWYWLQDHLRILSGLYGILRPLDLIQAYRLEMGSRLATPAGKNLYAFWDDTLTQALAQLLSQQQQAGQSEATLVNLASEEYAKAVRFERLGYRVVSPVFEDWKDGKYRIISFYAKRARGMMCRYAAQQQLQTVEALSGFALDGYAFGLWRNEDTPVFRRKLAQAG